jgi:hypothetical protein
MTDTIRMPLVLSDDLPTTSGGTPRTDAPSRVTAWTPGEVRWFRGTLQQQWRDHLSGEEEWRDVLAVD